MKHIVDTGRLPDGLDLLSFCDGLVFFAPVALLVRTTAGVSAGQFFLLQALIAAAALLILAAWDPLHVLKRRSRKDPEIDPASEPDSKPSRE